MDHGPRQMLSPICLGTMRLPAEPDGASPDRLLVHAHASGLTSFHCSSEYASFPTFCEAWRRSGLANTGTEIIAKVAAPHFGEDRFSASAFRGKIEDYLSALGIEQLGVVQWLLRYDLKQEERRHQILAEAEAEIAATVADLKREGKIAALVAFPYTVGMADKLIGADFCDGLAVYLNPIEGEMDGIVQECGRAGKQVLAIRPFAAGRLFSETKLTPQDALNHVFSFPAVVTAIVSASSRRHLDELAQFASRFERHVAL